MSIAKTTRPHLLTREAAAARIEALETALREALASNDQRKLDTSVTAEQAAEYVRKERERNANRDKPIPAPKDGFINDYD